MADNLPAPTHAAAPGELMERVLIRGDLAALSNEQRAEYYLRVCESLGLNPMTQPFAYIVLNGRLTLYALRGATEQLRRLHHVSIEITSRERQDDLYIVTARASMPDGRKDESLAAVCLAGLKGDALSNALMRSETKAKRRVTLSICGLGMLDETEVPETAHQPPLATIEGALAVAPAASREQLERIDILLGSLRVTLEQARKRLQERYGVSEFQELSAVQASELEATLRASLEKRQYRPNHADQAASSSPATTN